MTQLFKLNYTKFSAHLPTDTPRIWDLTVGLPDPKRMLAAMSGSSTAAFGARHFVVNHMTAALKRIEELEHQPVAPTAPEASRLQTFLDGMAVQMDAITTELIRAGLMTNAPVADQPFPELTLSGLVARLVDQLEAAKADHDRLRDENARLRVAAAKATPTSEDTVALRAELQDAKATLALMRRAPAEVRAQCYYTSWKALERRVAEKFPRLQTSDEETLAAIFQILGDKGYIQNIDPVGRVPQDYMLFTIRDIATTLPNAGEALAHDPVTTQPSGEVSTIQNIMGLGDPYPVALHVHGPAVGEVRCYRRMDLLAPVAVPQADVSGYQELEQINAKLEQQLQEAQRSLAGLSRDGVTYQILKREVSDTSVLTLKVREIRADGQVRDCVLVDHKELAAAYADHKAALEELSKLRPLAEERRQEIFFRTGTGTTYGCDNMSIGADGYVSDMAIKMRLPDGSDHHMGFINQVRVSEMLAEQTQKAERWQETATQHARNEEFYRDLLDQTAQALQDPEVFKSDDGSIQEEPIRLKVPGMVADVVKNGQEAHQSLAHNMVLLDRFRAGVRAISDPEEGVDEKLLGYLEMVKGRVLCMNRGAHIRVQSWDYCDGLPSRITGIYVDGAGVGSPLEFTEARVAQGPSAPPLPAPLQSLLDVMAEGLQERKPEESPLRLTFGTRQGDAMVSYHGFAAGTLSRPTGIVPCPQVSPFEDAEFHVESNHLLVLVAWRGAPPAAWPAWDAGIPLPAAEPTHVRL